MTQLETRPASLTVDGDGALSLDTLRSLQTNFLNTPSFRLAQNAVTRTGLDDVALNHQVVTSIDHTFSTVLDDWGVTDQKQTGRCWMFAGLNLLRWSARSRMGLKEFEFSQNFPLFWDKLERANYFFEAIVASADRDVGDRAVAFLLEAPLGDGGQWNMFINLVRKHGLVPKALMPETHSSSGTRLMNSVLRTKLREGARVLRDQHAAGASLADLRATKQRYLEAVQPHPEHSPGHAP